MIDVEFEVNDLYLDSISRSIKFYQFRGDSKTYLLSSFCCGNSNIIEALIFEESLLIPRLSIIFVVMMNCLVISNIVAYYIITFIAAAKYFYQERSVFICYYPKFSIIDVKCRVEKLYSFSVSFLPTASFLDTIISI